MTVVVETPSGKLAGREADGVRSFLGIPYAKPPVGPRRFAAPEPAEPWAGVRDAGAFGASAPQLPMILPLPGMDVGAQDEDCLYLNVYAPAGGAAKKPVMVWIHGGGFVIGSGSQSVYDGSRLARRGDVVVVTLNYRLGALGFLHLAELCPDLAGAVSNPGMRDQVAALEWVQRHIASFGGDPGNVTIFGESAGGMSVGTLLGMPKARGLFQRAIPQSGATHHFHTPEAATQVAEALLGALGVAAKDAARVLRELPAQKLIEAQGQLQTQPASSLGLLPFQPVVDGDSLPRPALQPVREGARAGVALLAGTTRDEWKLFSLMDPTRLRPRRGEAPRAPRPRGARGRRRRAVRHLPRRAARARRGGDAHRAVRGDPHRPHLPDPGGAPRRGPGAPSAAHLHVPRRLGIADAGRRARRLPRRRAALRVRHLRLSRAATSSPARVPTSRRSRRA